MDRAEPTAKPGAAAPAGDEGPRSEVILVVDDDHDIARYIELNLSLEGFTIHVAHDGATAVATAQSLRPDAVLLDVMMPGLDGYEVCRRLRLNARTSHCVIIMLTARTLSADMVLGLTAGADDYIAKPFDPPELVARVRAALRRAKQLRDTSPLTGLPGNSEISRQIEQLVATRTPFGLIHADLDHFKAYNDRYGFLRGDAAIQATADVLCDALAAHPSELSFLGHIGGDDFVLLIEAAQAEALAKEVIRAFDAMAPSLYDPEDAERGWIEIDDRRNNRHQVEIMTISLGVATTLYRPILGVGEASAIATEMKRAAKDDPASAFRIDQRRV